MINLLPGSEKERIYKNLLARQIRSLSVLAVTILVGSSIFILNTMVFLKVQSKELKQNLSVESLDAETRQADSLEETIKKLNVRLAKYREFRSDQISLLDVFYNLQEIVPPGGDLTALSVESKGGKIILSGQAGSREDVILMESRLKKSKFFERVESPISNFLEKQDSRFSFTFYLARP
ncbi:MAG: PilN domain-containing protein [Patescibacteria group bacterium]